MHVKPVQLPLFIDKRQSDKSHVCKNVQQTLKKATQTAITCSKLTIETLEQGVKYVQSKH